MKDADRAKFVLRLQKLGSANPEQSHDTADEILLEALRLEGCHDIADAYVEARYRVGFWYA